MEYNDDKANDVLLKAVRRWLAVHGMMRCTPFVLVAVEDGHDVGSMLRFVPPGQGAVLTLGMLSLSHETLSDGIVNLAVPRTVTHV